MRQKKLDISWQAWINLQCRLKFRYLLIWPDITHLGQTSNHTAPFDFSLLCFLSRGDFEPMLFWWKHVLSLFCVRSVCHITRKAWVLRLWVCSQVEVRGLRLWGSRLGRLFSCLTFIGGLLDCPGTLTGHRLTPWLVCFSPGPELNNYTKFFFNLLWVADGWGLPH